MFLLLIYWIIMILKKIIIFRYKFFGLIIVYGVGNFDNLNSVKVGVGIIYIKDNIRGVSNEKLIIVGNIVDLF